MVKSTPGTTSRKRLKRARDSWVGVRNRLMYTNRGAVHVPGTPLPLTALISPMMKEKPNKVTLSLAVGAVVTSLENSTASHSKLFH